MAYVNNQTDTLFADVSEFQAPVDDSYTGAGYRVLSFRSNDGGHLDANFAANYAWAVNAVNIGNLDFFIVYYYWRPDGSGVVNHMNQVNGAGGPHPKMVSMIDVESGDGNGSADNSSQLNNEYSQLGAWLGNRARVISYANASDYANIWPNRPDGLRVIGAGYPSDPHLPGEVAHQYTNGEIDGGLPMGAPPFGNCDMNSADGLSSGAFAAALGVPTVPPPPPPPAPPAPEPPALGEALDYFGPAPDPAAEALPGDDSIYSAAGVIIAQFLGSGDAADIGVPNA